MNIGRFSVRNSVLITIMMISVLILGLFSVVRLPREQFSEVPFFWVNIIVPYPGVSAEDIEQTVTIPVENEFQGIDRLKQIQSVTTEGLSVVRVEFDDGISNDEFDRLFQEARTRLGRVNLPEDTLPALIDVFSSSDFLPVIEVVVSGEAGYAEISRQALELSERIRKVPDVAGASLVGSRDRRILIEADRSRMESLGLSLGELIRTIQAQNATIPGGTLNTESREYLLRTVGRVDTAEEFGAVIVRRGSGSGEGLVRVRDVAAITEGFDERGVYARFNGEEAVTIRVSKVARGNSIAVIEGVKEQVEAFRKTLRPGIDITLSGDSTVQIKESIRVLLNNAVFGLFLLTGILFLFVGIRNALMTALGIPVTFALTFLILEAFGETLNSNTLFGLVLVLGLIVDHAIVITENSYRLQQEGLSRHDAAIQGTNQVVLPVLAGTLTTVAAFLPLMILPGTIGKFLRVIPFTVSIALLASTFEAIVFLPSHYADWPGGKVKRDRKERFDKVRSIYRNILERVYRRKGISVLVLSAAALGIFSLVPLLRQDLFSAEDFANFTISMELAPGSPVSRTSGWSNPTKSGSSLSSETGKSYRSPHRSGFHPGPRGIPPSRTSPR